LITWLNSTRQKSSCFQILEGSSKLTRNQKLFINIISKIFRLVLRQVSIYHFAFDVSEKKIYQGITHELNRTKKEIDNTFPIMFRNVKDNTVFFNSWFESGNLREVEKVSDLEYNLYLSFDFNTLNYTQWYYFSVRNIKKGRINYIKTL